MHTEFRSPLVGGPLPPIPEGSVNFELPIANETPFIENVRRTACCARSTLKKAAIATPGVVLASVGLGLSLADKNVGPMVMAAAAVYIVVVLIVACMHDRTRR